MYAAADGGRLSGAVAGGMFLVLSVAVGCSVQGEARTPSGSSSPSSSGAPLSPGPVEPSSDATTSSFRYPIATASPTASGVDPVVDVTSPLGETVAVTVRDSSGTFRRGRTASREEMHSAAQADLDGADIFADTLADDRTRLLVRWWASPCDTAAELTISPGVDSIVFQQAPRSGCDASGLLRGILLVFAMDLDPASIELEFHPTVVSGG